MMLEEVINLLIGFLCSHFLQGLSSRERTFKCAWNDFDDGGRGMTTCAYAYIWDRKEHNDNSDTKTVASGLLEVTAPQR